MTNSAQAVSSYAPPVSNEIPGKALYFAARLSGPTRVLAATANAASDAADATVGLASPNSDPGVQLFVSDGTAAGTVELTSATGSLSDPSQLTAIGNELFFSAYDASTKLNELWLSDGTASGTVEVSPTFGSFSDPNQLTAFGNRLYFSAYDPSRNAYELWTSDGTASGTGEITPTSGGFSDPENLTGLGNRLYFTASDASGQNSLWSTNGTAGGTVELSPGSFVNPGNLAVAGGQLYFVARDPTGNHDELWRTDGTATGVVELTAPTDSYDPNNLTQIGNGLYFAAYDPNKGQYELWRTDGTPSGTVELTPTTGSYSDSGNLTVDGSRVYFSAFDPNKSRYELWTTDGTSAGTVEITPSVGSFSDPQSLMAFGGRLYFDVVDPNTNVGQLWTTDGTPSGTVELTPATISPSNTGIKFNVALSAQRPPQEVAFDGRVYFTAYDSSKGQNELWSTDGTVAGTAEFTPAAGSFDQVSNLYVSNGALYFDAYGPGVGDELWRTDGTAAGTNLVADLYPGSTPGLQRLSNFAGSTKLYFDAIDPNTATPALWTSDGTVSGTVEVPSIAGFHNPSNLTAVGSRLYFSADDANHNGLWSTDGTASGTVEIIPASGGFSDPNGLVAAGNQLYFFASDAITDEQDLWTSNGTASGTLELIPTSGSFSNADNLTAVGGELYFTAADSSSQNSLWRTDGTPSSTVEVTPAPGSTFSDPANLTALGDHLYFSGFDSSNQHALWYIGAAGSAPVEVTPASGSSYQNPGDLTAAGGQLYFVASDSSNQNGLWHTGAAGSAPVEVTPASGSSYQNPGDLTAAGGQLYFLALDSSNQNGLWRTDATSSGTVEVHPVAGSSFSNPDSLTAIGGQLYFLARDPSTDSTHLWTTDGTSAGTVELNPSSGSFSNPSDLTVIGNQLYFDAIGSAGLQIWKTDGTASGTTMVSDVSYPNSSFPMDLTSGMAIISLPAPVISSPADGTTTNNDAPTITGTGTFGATVNLSITPVDGSAITATVAVAADGTWNYVPSPGLPDAGYTLTATQTDPAGNTSGVSAADHLTIDAQPPDAPAISSPADGGTVNGNQPTISGTGEGGATVNLTITSQDGNAIATNVAVGQGGTWSYTPSTALADAAYTVTATQTDAFGNVSGASPADHFTVKTQAYTPPAVQGGATAPLLTPATNQGGDTTPPVVAFDPTVSFSSPTKVTMTGTASDNAGVANVELFEGSTDLGAATLAPDGTWSFTTNLAPGFHTGLSAVATDSSGNSAAAASNFDLSTGVKSPIPDQPYTAVQDSYDASGAFLGQTFFRRHGAVLFSSSYTAMPDGSSSYTYSNGTYFNGKPYSSFTDFYTPTGAQAAAEALGNNDGTHTITAEENGVALHSIGADTMIGTGHSDHFVFSRGFGHDTITNFVAGGPGHDTVVLPIADVAHLAQIIGSTQTVNGDTTFHIDRHDSITLQSVTVAQLEAHLNDFKFHG